jgi:hypothetical protein
VDADRVVNFCDRPLERMRQVAAGLKAIGRIALQAALDDVDDRARQCRLRRRNRRMAAPRQCRDHRTGGVAAER